MEQVKSGQLRALAVTGAKRMPDLPGVPTVAEAGYPDLQFISWNGLHVPAGTPKAAIAAINTEVGRVRALPEVQKRMIDLGFTPDGGSPEDFAAFVARDAARWKEIVQETGVKVD
jgi:tripartite-type tricarboxylate transporter receptor subunit TctC